MKKHLTDEQILALAKKVVYEEPFSDEDTRAMLHISACDECFQLMQVQMALIQVTDNIG